MSASRRIEGLKDAVYILRSAALVSTDRDHMSGYKLAADLLQSKVNDYYRKKRLEATLAADEDAMGVN